MKETKVIIISMLINMAVAIIKLISGLCYSFSTLIADSVQSFTDSLTDVTSLVVPKRDERAIADAILKLYNNPDLCREMGEAGRTFVVGKYELNLCFEHICNLFSQICGGSK